MLENKLGKRLATLAGIIGWLDREDRVLLGGGVEGLAEAVSVYLGEGVPVFDAGSLGIDGIYDVRIGDEDAHCLGADAVTA